MRAAARFVATALCISWFATEGSIAAETVKPLMQQNIPNIPGKSLTAAIVDFPPGATSEPHRHGDAFVYAYVLSGSVRSQIDDAPAKVYRTGENWFEPPGAHHKLSQNTSRTKPARLLVVFVGTSGAPLKVADKP